MTPHFSVSAEPGSFSFYLVWCETAGSKEWVCVELDSCSALKIGLKFFLGCAE